jgi:hypothetical protein
MLLREDESLIKRALGYVRPILGFGPVNARAYLAIARVALAERIWLVPPRGAPSGATVADRRAA